MKYEHVENEGDHALSAIAAEHAEQHDVTPVSWHPPEQASQHEFAPLPRNVGALVRSDAGL